MPLICRKNWIFNQPSYFTQHSSHHLTLFASILAAVLMSTRNVFDCFRQHRSTLQFIYQTCLASKRRAYHTNGSHILDYPRHCLIRCLNTQFTNPTPYRPFPRRFFDNRQTTWPTCPALTTCPELPSTPTVGRIPRRSSSGTMRSALRQDPLCPRWACFDYCRACAVRKEPGSTLYSYRVIPHCIELPRTRSCISTETHDLGRSLLAQPWST